MIKFVREDTGMYVAMALIGAGVGLLVGVAIDGYLRNRKLKKLIEDYSIEEENDSTDSISMDYEEVVDDKMLRERKNKSFWETPAGIAFLNEFEHQPPTIVQMKLVEANILSLDVLAEELNRLYETELHAAERDSFDYNKTYRTPVLEDEKPDSIFDAIEASEIPYENPRFKFSDYDDLDGLLISNQFYFDWEDGTFTTYSAKGNPVHLDKSSIQKYFPLEVAEEIARRMEDDSVIYVQDLELDKIYRVDLLEDADDWLTESQSIEPIQRRKNGLRDEEV